MKYPEEMYIESQIFSGDMDGSESNLTEKVVKIRNSHLCCVCEKQIPKKPTYEGDGYTPDGTFVWDEWICQNCGSRYELEYDDYEYCPNCGQAIDWSGNVEEKTEEK